MAVATRPPVGALLREWRLRRRLSQFELGLQAGVSSRHLSFVETGRARPSAEMVLHLPQELDVPLRDRNYLLLAAGYAPAFAQRELDAPEMGRCRRDRPECSPAMSLSGARHRPPLGTRRGEPCGRLLIEALPSTSSSRRSTSYA